MLRYGLKINLCNKNKKFEKTNTLFSVFTSFKFIILNHISEDTTIRTRILDIGIYKIIQCSCPWRHALKALTENDAQYKSKNGIGADKIIYQTFGL